MTLMEIVLHLDTVLFLLILSIIMILKIIQMRQNSVRMLLLLIN